MLLLGAAADDATRKYNTARADFDAIVADSSKAKQRTPYEKLIKRFDKIERQNSNDDLAHRSAYMSAMVAEELSKASRVPSDLDEAISRMRRLADHYPASRLADDALLAAARMALERRGDKEQARELLGALIARFPQGDMVGQARELYARLPAPDNVVVAGVDGSLAATNNDSDKPVNPVDRIGDLLKKAEIIRSRAGEHSNDAAAVIDAELELREVETHVEVATVENDSATAVAPSEAHAEVLSDAPLLENALPELAQATETKPAHIHAIKVVQRSGQDYIDINIDAAITFKRGEVPATTKPKRPRRVFFDLSSAKIARDSKNVRGNTASKVLLVRAGQNTLDTVRIVIELSDDTAVQDLQRSLNGYSILIGQQQIPDSPLVAGADKQSKNETKVATQQTQAIAPKPTDKRDKLDELDKEIATSAPASLHKDMMPKSASSGGMSYATLGPLAQPA
jgi:tetratricopeptide (TPR) repeat protein